MHIPRFWTRVRVDVRGEPDPNGPAIAFGWSDEGPEQAHAHGLERAQRVAAMLSSWNDGEDGDLQATWQYYPLDRPLREPVVSTLCDEASETTAAITRNGYGAYVLNTTRVMFVDLDLPRAPLASLWQRLTGNVPVARDDVAERVRAYVLRHPGLGLRLYRTAAGYRALVTSRVYDPTSLEAMTLLSELGTDPLYLRLTEAQACFRARLTPKPWRLSLPSPQTHWFPNDDDPARKARFERWDATYEAARGATSVCRFVDRFGAETVADAVWPVLELHDTWCCTGQPTLA